MGNQFDAEEKMAESLINLVEFKITVPLTAKTKNIHTNSFIYLQGFDFLEQYADLYEQLGTTKFARHIPYRRGYWYVKNVKTNYASNKQEMELTLSVLPTYYKNKLQEKAKTNTNTANNTTNAGKTNTVKTNKNTKLHKVKGCKDQTFLEDIVRKAIGTKTDIEKQAIACYKYYQSNHVYHEYSTNDLIGEYNRGFKTLWNQKRHNCGAGAVTLMYMFRCLGLKPQVLNGHNHYWIRVKINGKTYYCDQAGAEGTNNVCTNGKRRNMSTKTGHCVVYGGAKGGSVRMG